MDGRSKRSQKRSSEFCVSGLKSHTVGGRQHFAHKNPKMQFLENKYTVWFYKSSRNENRFLELLNDHSVLKYIIGIKAIFECFMMVLNYRSATKPKLPRRLIKLQNNFNLPYKFKLKSFGLGDSPIYFSTVKCLILFIGKNK